jgi:hypothetical protein
MSALPHLTARPDFRSRLRLRPFRRDDAAEAACLLPPWMHADPEHLQALTALWQQVADEPAVVSAVQEDMALPAGHRLQGWGFSLIMPRGWADGLMADGQADAARCSHAARDVYAALLGGHMALPTEREIARANAGDGIAFLAMHYGQHEMDMTQPYALRVLNMANEGLRVMHAGYRVAAFYMQATAADEPWIHTAGLRQRHVPLPAPAAAQTMLYGLTRDEAAAMLPGQSARHFFEHQPPRFRFSASQRRLLWLSLFDEPDDGLMLSLDVSVHGLKKLWRGIYERIDDVEPEFFGDTASDDDGKRGPEKRRQVLAYVRQRPEELRPWGMA